MKVSDDLPRAACSCSLQQRCESCSGAWVTHELDVCMETSQPSFDPKKIMFFVGVLPHHLHIHCRQIRDIWRKLLFCKRTPDSVQNVEVFFPHYYVSLLSCPENCHKLTLWVNYCWSRMFDLFFNSKEKTWFHPFSITSLRVGDGGCWSQSAANLPHLQSKDMRMRQIDRVITQTQGEHATNKALAWESNLWPFCCQEIVGAILSWNARWNFPNIFYWNISYFLW